MPLLSYQIIQNFGHLYFTFSYRAKQSICCESDGSRRKFESLFFVLNNLMCTVFVKKFLDDTKVFSINTTVFVNYKNRYLLINKFKIHYDILSNMIFTWISLKAFLKAFYIENLLLYNTFNHITHLFLIS